MHMFLVSLLLKALGVGPFQSIVMAQDFDILKRFFEVHRKFFEEVFLRQPVTKHNKAEALIF